MCLILSLLTPSQTNAQQEGQRGTDVANASGARVDTASSQRGRALGAPAACLAGDQAQDSTHLEMRNTAVARRDAFGSMRIRRDSLCNVPEAIAPTLARPEAPPPPPARTIGAATGIGTLTIGGEIQVWYTDGSGASDNSFRLRRVDLRIVGQVNPRVSWTFQIDAAKALAVNGTYTSVDGKRVLVDQNVSQASRILQDAFVVYAPRPSLQLTMGQFRIPFTNEGMSAVSRYETVEQAMFMSDRARGGGLAAVRDIGVMLSATRGKYLDAHLGAFNSSGDSQNSTDHNDQKAVVARVLLRPSVAGWQLGLSGVMGGTPTNDRPRRDRAAAEAQFVSKRVTVRSELVTAVDDERSRVGYYLHGGYKLWPGFEALARFDSWDPDRHAESASDNTTAREVLIGFTRYLEGHSAKLQFNLSRRRYARDLIPSATMLAVAMQAAW